ncbi:hypothetical protein GCM10027061_15330 [Nesterenkonia suensis]
MPTYGGGDLHGPEAPSASREGAADDFLDAALDIVQQAHRHLLLRHHDCPCTGQSLEESTVSPGDERFKRASTNYRGV